MNPPPGDYMGVGTSDPHVYQSDDLLDESYVIQLLPRTLAKEDAIRGPAAERVMALEKQPGFASILVRIAADRSADEALRLQCILFVKNIVNRYWRPRNDPPVSNEEKAIIRSSLLMNFMEEPSDLVSIQVAILIGMIAKLDWPRIWPELLPTLAEAFLQGTGLTQLRGLLMLHHMVKELTYRSGRGAKLQFREMAHVLFSSLLQLWQHGSDLVLTMLGEFSRGEIGEEKLCDIRFEAEVSKWAVKILSGLVVYAFEDFSEEPLAVSFYEALLDRFPYTLECAVNVQNNILMRYIHTYNKVYGKLLLNCQYHDSKAFLAIAQPALNFALEQIRSLNNIDDTAVRSMKLVMAVILGLGKVGEYKGDSAEILLMEHVFTEARIKELVQVLIEHYFTLTYEELDEWSQNPELAYLDQVNCADADDFLRSVAESLFLAIIEQWPSIVIPIVLQSVDACMKESQLAFQDPTQQAMESYFSLPRILFRDACYHAVATCHHQLDRHIDFSDWFLSHLQKEIQELNQLNIRDQQAEFDFRTSILKRRVCILTGKWVTAVKDSIRPNVYEVFVTMLTSESDLGVVLPAIWTLECLVYDMSFTATFETFEQYIDPVISSLFNVIQMCKYPESQLKILHCLGAVIEGISSHVQPYTTKILELVSGLWQSNNESLMQTALIRTLGKLVVSLEGDASQWYSHLMPIINYATCVTGRSSDNVLLEDGMLLWLCTLRSATEFSDSLLQLFKNLSRIIQGGMTNVILSLCIKLVESYVLLGQVQFLQAHVDDLASIFSIWIGETQDEITSEVMRPLEVMLMLYPSEMPIHFESILTKMIEMIFSGRESDLALCYYIHFFNRLLLHNPQFYGSWIDRLGNESGKPDLLVTFIQLVIDRIDQLGDLRRRKIAAMALCNLVEWPDFLASNPELIGLAIQTAIGVVCDEEQGDGPEYLVRPDETHLTEEVYVPELSPRSVQARQLDILYTTDPVNKTTGREYLMAKLAVAEQTQPAAFVQMMATIEPLVLESLNQVNDSESESE